MASITLITGLGLVGAIIYASSSPPCGAIIICIILAAIALPTIWLQCRRAYSALLEEEEVYKHAKSVFEKLADPHKMILESLCIQKYTKSGSPTIEETGFVAREFTTGMYSIRTEYLKIIPRLVQEWRSEQKKSAIQS